MAETQKEFIKKLVEQKHIEQKKKREELFEEKLIEQTKKERQAELEKIKKIDIEDPQFNPLKDILRDRAVASQSKFTAKGAKQAGVSAGYITQENETGDTYLLKHLYKTQDACLTEKLTDEEREKAKSLKDLDLKAIKFVQTLRKGMLTTSEIQGLEIEEQYVLINKKVQAVVDRKDGVHELIASTMYQFLLYNRAPKEGLVKGNENHPNSIYVRSKFFDNSETLSESSGLSDQTRVKANDKNLQNLQGFEKVIAACHILGEADYHAGNLMVQDGKTITKIDHGRSFLAFPKDFGDMIRSTAEIFAYPEVGYGAAIKAGNLSFSINKYSEALNQMIRQLDGQQVEAIIDQKIDELKKAGFDPKGMTEFVRVNDKFKPISIENFDDLRKHYKENIKENLVNMQEVAKGAEIVTKFSNVSPKFKNGGWLEAFASSSEKDPVLYAINNNIQIENKDAKKWAHDNNYPKGSWQDKVEIEHFDPVKSQSAQDKHVAEKLESLIVDFTKQAATKNVTDKEVKKFYNNIMKELKKENYLTEQDIERIKQDSAHKDNIKNMIGILNTKSSKLNSQDIIYYKVGKFCEKIGLFSISNYFTNKISPESISKIRDTGLIVAKTIQISEQLKQNQDKAFEAEKVQVVQKSTVSIMQSNRENQKPKSESRGR